MADGVLALVPARGGSKGVPAKNLRPLAGLPLIAHAIRCAARCPEVARIVVSTDSEEIAAVASAHGAEVPFVRPAELATDEAAMWPVVVHAVEHLGTDADVVLLLDPTTPARLPEDVAGALATLRATPDADGIVGVSRPGWNPIWTGVRVVDGWLEPLFPEGTAYTRRQDVPEVLRIDASLYAWRTSFIRSGAGSWRDGRLLAHEVPPLRAVHLDEETDFAVFEALLAVGLVTLPWLD
jgi:CMP-N,N'-diacetyllegionaminic acid synthase